MTGSNLRIAVVGAGLGGLTAALALQRAGFRPVLFEQAAVLGDVGAGISITPNAAKGLESLGLDDALERLAEEPPAQSIRDWRSGEELMRIDRTATRQTYGAAYYMLHRADLHAMLVAAVRDVDAGAIRLNAPLTGVTPRGEEVELSFGDGRRVVADAVVAADGVRSIIRSALFGHVEARFTGHVAWRGLVPAERLPEDDARPGSIVWTGPGKSFVRYPVRRGRLVNYVGLSRTDRWRGEGWSQRVSIADALAEFDDWPAEVQRLLRATPDSVCHSWGLFVRAPLPSFVAGRVALIGDAAHPMLPFMGQGAAMAIEDGVVLGRCFAAAATVEDALARYDAARVERATFIQAESAAGADRLQTDRPQATPNGRLARGEDALGLFRYDPATAAIDMTCGRPERERASG